MNNGKNFALRITALMLCLFTISAGLSSCGYFSEAYLASVTERPAKTQDKIEITYPKKEESEPGTTYVPQTVATSEATAAPETTKAPETTDNIPDDVQNNVYLSMMNKGRCESLVGKVTVTVITVSDEVSIWTDSALSELSASLSAQEKEIEKLAASYGKSLDLTFSYLGAKITGDAAKGDYATEWIEDSLSKAGLPTLKEAGKQLDSQNGSDSNPIIFALNKSGRAYAQQQSSKNNTEYAVVFSSDLSSFTHEFYHIYGAEDFYYPELVKDLADNYLSESVMNSGEKTDPLTAFIIGWDDEMDPEALEFLKQTNHLTRDYLKSENEKQSVTGNVTSFQLRYGVYTGYLERGTPDGYGELIYTAGDRYKGDFDGGNPHGKGKYTWVDGDTYEGDWVDGKRTGNGTYTWSNGNRFVGKWINGIRTGEGTLTFADGSVYKGNWENDKYSGKGKMTWADGSYYEGDYKDGERHGKGSYHYANGNVYVGDWVMGERNGQGTFTYAGGTVYVGSFVDGKFVGKGKMTWSDGSYYEGDYKDGERHGKGTYTFADGSVYVGDWVNGNREGMGSYTTNSGFKYNGGWKSDKYHGYGETTYTDGGTYKGNFENGLREGQGTYTYPAGHVYTGQWSEGSRTGYGVMKWSDGSSYDGNWKDNKRHGYGKYVNKNGQIFNGQWQNDVFQG